MTKTELIKKWQESESVHHDTAYSVSQLERLLSSLCGVMASELFEGGDATLGARKAILEKEREKVRERMAEMQAGLDRLDYKIAHYEDLIVKAEQKMAGGPE